MGQTGKGFPDICAREKKLGAEHMKSMHDPVDGLRYRGAHVSKYM